MDIVPGTAWRSPEPPRHVFIVLSSPDENREVLVVNLTTLRDSCIDDAAIFDGGEHPAIVHQTTVAYSRAKAFSVDKMSDALDHGILSPVSPFEGEVLDKILDGARSSPELAFKFKKMID